MECEIVTFEIDGTQTDITVDIFSALHSDTMNNYIQTPSCDHEMRFSCEIISNTAVVDLVTDCVNIILSDQSNYLWLDTTNSDTQ